MSPFELSLQNELNVQKQWFANNWLFIWHNINIPHLSVDVDDFRGGRIRVSGIVFGGQIQQIFWQTIDRYIATEIHRVFNRWNEETNNYPIGARQSSLMGTSILLKTLVANIVNDATSTDRSLRGKGFPDRIQPYNSSGSITKANAEISRVTRSYQHLNEETSQKENPEDHMEVFEAFNMRVQRRLNEMSKDAQKKLSGITSAMAARGLTNSGPRVVAQLDEIKRCLNDSIDWTFTEAERLPGQKEITRSLIRHQMLTNLNRFLEALYPNIHLTSLTGGVAGEVESHRTEMRSLLHSEVNDFSIGIWSPRNRPKTLDMITNHTINIGGNNEGIVQQANDHAQQSAVFEFSAEKASAAADQLLKALESASLAAEAKDEILAEIETVKLQLKRQRPNLPVMRAAVEGLKQLGLGIAGNVLTPHIVLLAATVGIHLSA